MLADDDDDEQKTCSLRTQRSRSYTRWSTHKIKHFVSPSVVFDVNYDSEMMLEYLALQTLILHF